VTARVLVFPAPVHRHPERLADHAGIMASNPPGGEGFRHGSAVSDRKTITGGRETGRSRGTITGGTGEREDLSCG
jgi:hypothetical protein